ncbi:MAG: ribosome biogenesis/translation initiation ATPase RLI [Candidatus Thermoplasmatota archaeon]|nr:ribosome biogenesis/translation initiation ATPase RLI [Candidatus Thermoplasmatota archaeon]MCL5441074.1 ribosome biogenesis/translation initiation ATPase RLI [Candidatus Thermoplasmatota archaeon]
MHIAVLDQEKCHPKKCNHECQYYCPPVRSGIMTIDFPNPEGQPLITENLCIGCGICQKRCPFGAIKIITVPDELNRDVVHQYGVNSFRIYSMPTLARGKVTALLGQNGMGKSTTLKILAGITVPNFGKFDVEASKDTVIDHYSGTLMGSYFRDLYAGKTKVVLKDQHVDLIPRVVKGTLGEILKRGDLNNRLDEVTSKLDMEGALGKDVSSCSGGELQKLAIASSLLKDGDIYLFDEMSSYLDVNDRMRVASIVKDMAEKKTVMIVEHDLALMDWMADTVHLVYGSPGAYGVISEQKTTNRAINAFLTGYLREENVRIRPYEIQFQDRSHKVEQTGIQLVEWSDLSLKLAEFSLDVSKGYVKTGETIGVLGRNALGKTTFVKMLAGVLKPDTGTVSATVRVAYKPQYISIDFQGTVRDLILSVANDAFSSPFIMNEVLGPMQINELMDALVNDLSGGELQRVSIATTLARDADIYLLDEPSAHLDSAFRMAAAKIIRRVMENNRKSAMVVDHDVYFIDLISDKLIVFSGKPGIYGRSFGPTDMKTGMNIFLKDAGVTFRRDQVTKRPRINKQGSSLDRMQKNSGNYYYSE